MTHIIQFNTTAHMESSVVQTATETLTITPAVAAAAQRVAKAEALLAEQQRVAAQANEARDGIHARIAALDARRDGIKRRRLDGDARNGDGAELELIALDREGLEELGREAAATVAERVNEESSAASALEAARAELARAEDLAEIDALKQHADAVGAVMLETVRAIGAVGRRIGGHNFRWVPSEALLDALRGAKIAGRPL